MFSSLLEVGFNQTKKKNNKKTKKTKKNHMIIL